MEKTWLPVNGFPDYEVSDQGDVRNVKTGRMRNPYLRNGYLSLKLRIKTGKHAGKHRNLDVHRLVAEHFCERPKPYRDYPYVNHISLDKHDNRASNLEWVTAARNTQHYFQSRNLPIPDHLAPCSA